MSEYKFAAVHTIFLPSNQGPIPRDEIFPVKTLDEAHSIAYSLHSQGAQNVAVIDLPEPLESYREKLQKSQGADVRERPDTGS